MLSNAYFLAKFRFDTAENEPAKNLQNLLISPILLTPNPYPQYPQYPYTPRSRSQILPEVADASGEVPGCEAGWSNSWQSMFDFLGFFFMRSEITSEFGILNQTDRGTF